MVLLGGSPAAAATLDGATLGGIWAVPFAGLLVTIALAPLIAPHLWHRAAGPIAAGWAAAFVVPFAVLAGPGAAFHEVVHVLLAEYLPFVVVLGALFTISGGLLVEGDLHGDPRLNTALLALGTVLASVIGTTGASMVLIRPLLRANAGRRHPVHVVVFFIFLVSNIGGALTPLGDPPLFLGYLLGVDFFWTARHLFAETAVAAGALLALFFVVDTVLYRRDADYRPAAVPPEGPVALRGRVNLGLLVVVIAAVLMSGSWKPGIVVPIAGTDIELQNLLRDLVLVAAAAASLALTPAGLRARNGFTWAPIREVAELFAAIFVTIVPVIAMLKAAEHGAFAPLVALVARPGGSPDVAMYFWATGLLSSFLDNAPTYLVFFNLAGGDAARLMGEGAAVLVAISCGAVFMGANSYIGNAPNFMVKAIAEDAGVPMPSFFGYLVWSFGILTPLFVVITVLFLRV
ncbi:sodium:proton antiporter [Siculibacillus lacustris]|uniref:Sodium:proton antiporter n=2 Tax=Siculibacillus lacustris TaxID=1549641 RepID=A0A4V2KUG1_9HYPH|nr:sodium:proton antiporter [Siculibacillus lacustris]